MKDLLLIALVAVLGTLLGAGGVIWVVLARAGKLMKEPEAPPAFPPPDEARWLEDDRARETERVERDEGLKHGAEERRGTNAVDRANERLRDLGFGASGAGSKPQ